MLLGGLLDSCAGVFQFHCGFRLHTVLNKIFLNLVNVLAVFVY